MNPKINIHQEYINYHNHYVEKYGPKTIVLMQVGSFFEMYMTNDAGPNLKELSQLLNIICTKKDKTVKEISIKNPYMLGFPLVSTDKFITLLINAGFTIATIEQVTSPPEPQRKCTNIYSPSTYISNTPTVDTNYAVILYFEYETQKLRNKTSLPLLCTGMSAIDVSTGAVLVDESHSTLSDTEIALDDALRFLSNTQPKEIFLIVNGITKDCKMSVNTIIDYLQLDSKILKIKTFESKYIKLNYQEEFLKNIYTNTSMVSIIENLDLEHKNYGRTALIMLIDYISDYNKNIVKNLSFPQLTSGNQNLIMGNNASYQLSVIEHDAQTYMFGTKFKSLYDVVNNAITAMGKRYIKYMLLNPYTDISKIQTIQNNISILIKNNIYKEYPDKLSNISDIEKLKRKLNLGILHPYEMAEFISSFDCIKNLLEDISKLELNNIVSNKEIIKEITEFNKLMNKIFNVENLKQNTLRDIKTNFFNNKIDNELDKIMGKFNKEYNSIVVLHNKFNAVLKHITKKKKSKKNEDTELITIQNTKTEGYYLQVSSLRYKIIEEFINKSNNSDSSEEITTSDSNDEEKEQFKHDINLNELEIKKLKSVTKIYFKTKTTDNMTDILDELLKYVENLYKIKLKEIYDKYNDMFDKTINIITHFDYILSGAITAIKYGYTKPKLTNSKSYFKATDLRHPIVERLIDYEYIPHSIELGNKLNGMLIYGLNSSGKSVLMKAVGLSVIMAQCGMYVPAKSFELSPYKSIYTRITGNDNLFKGLSSFTLEMIELNSIIKRADENSLIIGDEVCRGTEHISGNALVASTIVSLSKVKSSFIFATHLHELVDLNCIKTLSNVKAFHLSVDFDAKTDTLIYDRKLKEGSGDKVYGILVAKYIINNKDFIELTTQIKNELTNIDSSLIPNKKSRYNSDVYVYKCQICNKNDVYGDRKPLQTHHINHQEDCDDNDRVIGKEYILKNSKANLLVMCEECHKSHHKGDLEISGIVMTSKGKKIK